MSEKILNTFPFFESNQVLTNTQLNNLVAYLDQQNRYTRAKLIGMGVACGLEASYNSSADELVISKGTAVTSEGYLICIGECKTVKYRPYTLPPGTIYEPFVNANHEQDVDLFELLTEEAEDGPEVHALNSASFLSNKVVLLFVESYDKDLKSCLGKSCDELGKERILTIRKLLISENDLETKVFGRTNGGKLDASFPGKFDLPHINMPRVLFNPEELHSSEYDAFSENYVDAVNIVFEDLIDALVESYDLYRPLLLESYGELNPFTNSPLNSVFEGIRDFLDNNPPGESYLGIQYVYDLTLDLIMAYNEFRQTAFRLMSECCPDVNRFPMHVMLGEADASDPALAEDSEFRNYFVQPPIYNMQKELLQRTVSLHNRIVLMIESFDLEKVNGAGDHDLRITPSLEKTTPLSRRSVPWYYNESMDSSYDNLGTLKEYWDFDHRSMGLSDEVLSYGEQANDHTAPQSRLETPLYYDIQDTAFFRIEGYLQKEYSQVLGQLEELKTKYNLPFKTIALQLDEDTESLDLDYSCGFEDIQEEYTVLAKSVCNFIPDIKAIYKHIEKYQAYLFDDGDEIEVILKAIEELLELLDKLCSSLPDCVEKFDFMQFQHNYKNLLNHIIDFFLVEMGLMEEIEIDLGDDEQIQIDVINGFVQRLFPVFHKLVDLLFYNRFLRMYYSFKRREYYLKTETSVFSSYLKKHPGLEHHAGVEKGGTFIMIYRDAESHEVIADFSLPYICCSEDKCVPACDEGSSFKFEMPPFARPDYAITTREHKVIIEVMRNDSQLFIAPLDVKDYTNPQNGELNTLSSPGIFEYIPNKDFIGYDSFEYTLVNTDTGKSDKAIVTILVKDAEGGESCYSRQIFECWGSENVKQFLAHKNLNPGNDPIGTLLNYVQSNYGFSLDDLNYILETNMLEKLISCIDPSAPPMSGGNMQEWILEYQADNCQGDAPQEPTGGVNVNVGSLKTDEMISVMNARGVPISSGSSREKVENEFLASPGGSNLSKDEMMLLSKNSITGMLVHKGIGFSARDTKSNLVDKLFSN